MDTQELVRNGTLVVTGIGLMITTVIINAQIVRKNWHWAVREIVGMLWTLAVTFGITMLISMVEPRLVPWELPFMGAWGTVFLVIGFFSLFLPNEWRRQVGI